VDEAPRPMSQWGIFETDDGVVHVVPFDAGEDETTHELSERCRCHPWYDDNRAKQGTAPLLIHEHVT
jgi:hypothetical protein